MVKPVNIKYIVAISPSSKAEMYALSLVLVILRDFEKSKIECKKQIWHKIFKNSLISYKLGPMYLAIANKRKLS